MFLISFDFTADVNHSHPSGLRHLVMLPNGDASHPTRSLQTD